MAWRSFVGTDSNSRMSLITKYTNAGLLLTNDSPAEPYRYVELKLNPDGKPCLYQLYLPEEDQFKDPNLYLWVRRCELFTSVKALLYYMKHIIGIKIQSIEEAHELFPELSTITDHRGRKYYVCLAIIHHDA